MRFRLAAALFALLFAYAAALQTNDPDPLGWLAIYAVAAVLSGLAAFLRAPRAACLALAAAAVVWAALLAPEVLSEAAFRGTEEERELVGLLLVAAWMLRVGLRQRRPARREARA